MPFPVPTPSQILDECFAEVQDQFPNSDPRLQNSFLGVMCKAFTLAIHGLYLFLRFIVLQPFAVTASSENLDLIGTEIGVDRIEATAASGTVTATGVNTTVIPIGSELTDGNDVRYATTAEGTIAGGIAVLPVDALTFGSNTNQATGVNLNFVSPIAGVDTLATVDAPGLLGGTDIEDDESYRARVIARRRNPIQCGTASDYEQWALEVADVTRAFVFPQEAGPGSVTVRFMMDDKFVDGIPLAADIAAVTANITDQMPINVVLFVLAPVAVPLDIDVRITPFNTEVEAAVVAELNDLFIRDTAPGGGLFISRIREAVSNAPGEFDNIVDDPTADVPAGGVGDILVPGTFTINSI